MPDLQLHKAQVVGHTLQGGHVHATGYSGNFSSQRYRIYKLSRVARASAAVFCNYLSDLTDQNSQYGGGKTAFTCAEPKAVIEALILGATLDSIRVYGIKCGRDSRTPCDAFCSEYLFPVANKSGWYEVVVPKEYNIR